jgi:hypothetical protein
MRCGHRRCRCAGSVQYQELEEIGRQVVELGTTRFAPEQPLDAPAKRSIGRLPDQGGDLRLRLVADAEIGQPGCDGVRCRDAARIEVDLIVDVEAMNVVVQGVEQVKAAPRPDQTRQPPPDEDLPSTAEAVTERLLRSARPAAL